MKEKKRCTVLKDASVYILADYRNKKNRKLIERLYGYCMSQHYDLKWVGFTESSPDMYDSQFTVDGRTVSFSSSDYEKFDRSNVDAVSNIVYVFIGTPVKEDERPEIVCLTTSFSDMRAKKIMKVANDFVHSPETDARMRFLIPKSIAVKEVFISELSDPDWLLLSDFINIFDI